MSSPSYFADAQPTSFRCNARRQGEAGEMAAEHVGAEQRLGFEGHGIERLKWEG
jgi:hypothetical protein